MNNDYRGRNGEKKEITDPLKEPEMYVFQEKLEKHADNLQSAEERRVKLELWEQQEQQSSDQRNAGEGDVKLELWEDQEQQPGRQEQRSGRRGQQSGRQERKPGLQERQSDHLDSGSIRYEKGYYDGYADALDEINERLAAEEEDEYDFGRGYSRKPARRKMRETDSRRDAGYHDSGYGDGENEVGKRKRRERGERRGHPVLRTFVIVLILIILAGVLLVRSLFGRVTRVDPVADLTADAHANEVGVVLMSDPAVKNILLIGSDSRGAESTSERSDTMILCSINSNTRTVTLTSLMRDMYLPIPDYGYDKLNAAFAYGGMLLLDETVQEDFGIDINGNALVDFEAFIRALTAVGDIEIELTQEEADYLNYGGWEDQGIYGNDGTWNLQAGMNSLDPSQALAYCRIRYIGNSDWDRTERQRKVIVAALSKFRHSSPFTQYKVVSEAMSSVTMDMSNKLLLSLLFRAALLRNIQVDTYLIPVDGTYYIDYVNGMDVLVPDLGQNSYYLKEYIYG